MSVFPRPVAKETRGLLMPRSFAAKIEATHSSWYFRREIIGGISHIKFFLLGVECQAKGRSLGKKLVYIARFYISLA